MHQDIIHANYYRQVHQKFAKVKPYTTTAGLDILHGSNNVLSRISLTKIANQNVCIFLSKINNSKFIYVYIRTNNISCMYLFKLCTTFYIKQIYIQNSTKLQFSTFVGNNNCIWQLGRRRSQNWMSTRILPRTFVRTENKRHSQYCHEKTTGIWNETGIWTKSKMLYVTKIYKN